MPSRLPARPKVPLAAAPLGPTETPAPTDLRVADDDDDVSAEPAAATIDHDVAPFQADLEQVVVLFADGQDAATRTLLDRLVRSYQGAEALRFWRMYFDVLQLIGDRAGFERLGLEFAQRCETSPPTWRTLPPALPAASAEALVLGLQGVLTADHGQALLPLRAALAKRRSVHLDCGKLLGCDDDIAGQLAAMLHRARREGGVVVLTGAEGLTAHLRKKLVDGQRRAFPAWCLFLELLQHLGPEDEFEEVAVRFAVTFEQSPPSWEPAPLAAEAVPPAAPPDDALYLSGEIAHCRFENVQALCEQQRVPVLDFSAVRRLDFFSAGQLANRIAQHGRACDAVVIRNPNHLVAELLTVVGVDSLARLLVAKA